MAHLDRATLEAGLEGVAAAPRGRGRLELIVRRPQPGERELLETAQLDLDSGLVGDNWRSRGGPRGGPPKIDAQLTVMSARAAALVSGGAEPAGWAPAGDQLYVDLDLGAEHLPAGSRVAIGAAVVEITAEPHLGCGKFARRFGVDALKFVNSEVGKSMRLRGVNARVLVPGAISVGDEVRRLDPPDEGPG